MKGLPLTKEPAEIVDGWSVFNLSEKVDIWESMNRANAQIFPGTVFDNRVVMKVLADRSKG